MGNPEPAPWLLDVPRSVWRKPSPRLFAIHPGVAVKYVQTAHPDKALPPIR